ncbi:MAG: flippase-like domain-containing protein, partial [Planctomycetes bacterium]|nr:flippase-like domain-containing protein [Planctomycetota bacterium]
MAEADGTSRSPGPRGGWRRLLVLALKWGLFAAVLFFVGRALVTQFAEVSWETVHFNVPLVVLAAVCVVVARGLCFVAYGFLVRRMGHRPPWGAMAGTMWVAQTAKYVPGKIGSIVSLVLLWGRYGIPGQVTVSTVFIVDGLSVVIGMLFAIPLTLYEPLRSYLPMAWLWCVLGTAAALVCLHPRVFGWVGNRALRLAGYQPLPSLPRVSDYWGPIVAMLVQYFFLALGYWLVARSLTFVPASALPVLFSSVVVVTIASFLAFFAPGGVGVQEGLILLLFSPITGGGFAAVIAVLV